MLFLNFLGSMLQSTLQKCVGGRGCAPNLIGRTYSAPRDSEPDLREPLCGGGGRRNEERGRKGKRGRGRGKSER